MKQRIVVHGEQREIPNFKQALCSGRIAVPVENTVTGDLTVIQVSLPWQIRYTWQVTKCAALSPSIHFHVENSVSRLILDLLLLIELC